MAQIHHPKGADQRHWNDDCRDESRARVAQKQEHDQDDQDNGDYQCALHLENGGADGSRPVEHHHEIDRRRDGGFE